MAPPSFPLVTPVGPDGLAITTHAACDCPRGTMSATLPSGSVVGVEVLDPDGPFVVVSLPANAGVAAMAIADLSHGAPSTMTVMYGGVYTPIDPQSAAALCTPEAAPVLDDHGMLVGLCTDGDHGASIVAVDSVPPAPTTSTVPSTSSSPAISTSTVAPSSTTSCRDVNVDGDADQPDHHGGKLTPA